MSLSDRQQCVALVRDAETAGAGRTASCRLLGLSLRTLERWQKHPDKEDQRSGPKTNSTRALTTEEKKKMLQIANSEKYRDLNAHQIVVRLADSGQFIASASSFYRVFRAENLLAHRSKSKPKTRLPPRCLIAKGPNQVWSWDITYLMSSIRGKYFYLYVIEDIFSRLIVGWRVEERESAEFAAQLAERCSIEQSVEKWQVTLHSDNGSPMKGATMLATLQRLGVFPSRSRASVSNDNPFSEALFKTLKYCPQFPVKPFSTLEEARSWVEDFVKWYNTEHLHSEICYVTPASRHAGLDGSILKRRIKVYKKAKENNPLRWSKQTRNWGFISEVSLNPGKEIKQEKKALKSCTA